MFKTVIQNLNLRWEYFDLFANLIDSANSRVGSFPMAFTTETPSGKELQPHKAATPGNITDLQPQGRQFQL